MRIKKKMLLERFVLTFLLLYALSIRYLDAISAGNKILVLLLGACIIKNIKQFPKFISSNISVIISLVLIICLGLLNLIVNGIQQYTYKNSMILFYNLWILFGLVFINYILDNHILKFYKAAFYFLNLFWIINVFALGMQVSGSGFLIKEKWLAINSFYLDQCCGLFGNSGTHELAFFSLFIFVYNFSLSNYFKRKRYIRIYTIITEIILYYCSTISDNKALLIFLPFTVIILYFLHFLWSGKSVPKKVKYILGASISLILIIIVGLQNQTVYNKVNELLASVNRILHFNNENINGGNERIAIFMYALQNGNGFNLGLGLGMYNWTHGKVAYFNHFGLSSIGAFTLLGGVWFYLAIVKLYADMANKLFNSYKSNIITVVVMLIVIILSVYSNIFTSTVSSIWILLTFMVLRFYRDFYVINKK